MNEFFEPLMELLRSPNVAALSGYINIGLLGGMTAFYFKFIQPKLARGGVAIGALGQVSKELKNLNDDFMAVLGAFKALKKEIELIKRMNAIGYAASNLGDSTKNLIKSLSEIRVDDDFMNNLSKESRVKVEEATKQVDEEVKQANKTALQKLQEDLQIEEV